MRFQHAIGLLIFCVSLVSGGEPERAGVDESIKQLTDGDFDARERAAQALLNGGDHAREKLEQLLQRKELDPEIATRARKIIYEQEKALAPAQREINAAVYTANTALFEKIARSHQDKWLVIAGGKVLPVNAAGEPAPCDSLEAADAAAEKTFPRAAHRYVFKLGTDGDVKHMLGGTNNPFVVGMGLLSELDATWIAADDSFYVMNGNKKIEIGTRGPDERPHVEPELLAPIGETAAKQLFIVATGFNGAAIVPQEIADLLRLARWEIPGKAEIKGVLVSGAGRRAHVRLRFKNLPKTFTLAAVIWEKQK